MSRQLSSRRMRVRALLAALCAVAFAAAFGMAVGRGLSLDDRDGRGPLVNPFEHLRIGQ